MEPIAANTEIQETENEDVFRLSDGTVVTFVNLTTASWMKAKSLSAKDYMNTAFYALADVARFNGQKYTLQEIKQLPMSDGMALEAKFNELAEGKKH